MNIKYFVCVCLFFVAFVCIKVFFWFLSKLADLLLTSAYTWTQKIIHQLWVQVCFLKFVRGEYVCLANVFLYA